jgi:peroxiredoxin
MQELHLASDFDLDVMVTNLGNSLGKLSENQPVLLVFLRHFGCTFCREAIDELGKNKTTIESNGTRIIFVHMSEEQIAEEFFKEYNFETAEHVSDVMCTFYKEFGLVKGTMNQLFGFNNWARTIDTGILKGYSWGREIGDGFQMPGVFVIQNRQVMLSYIHKYVSDKPNYLKMAECCTI